MKAFVKKVLQFLMGFQNYLFVFALFIIYTLRWNKKEGDFLYMLRLLPDEGIILDVGANIGIMTVHLARKFPRARICAFEPVPHNIRALKRIIRYYRFKNVSIFETALGNYNGTARMIMPIIHSVRMQGLSHVINNNDRQDYAEAGDVFATPIRSLDSYDSFFAPSAHITGIKIDVENFEYYVLDGARRLISAHKPVIYCELWKNEQRDKCIELLKELGYSMHVVQKNELQPFDPLRHDKENFFFIPD